MKTIAAGIVFIVAAALFVAGCGGGSDGAKKLTLGSLTFEDHGTKDVSSQSAIEIEAGDFYFSPSFLKGTAGQKLKITVANDSSTIHNISVPALALDSDVAAKAKTEVNVTLPSSGVLLFICKYHSATGMNGELLVGDATPQAASATVATPAVKVTTNATLGKILTDPAGKTLYTFKNDVANSGKSTVTGNTLQVWPALTLASGDPIKPADATGVLGLITRDDGAKQITYNGLPLYYYARDANPGDTTGQGVGGNWFVVAP